VRKIEDKVWDYLIEHKRPVTIKQIAKYFIVSEGSVTRVLANFVKRQVVDKIRQGSITLYKIKD
jgi:Mn-dependent DtxR family transcriptional regulator